MICQVRFVDDPDKSLEGSGHGLSQAHYSSGKETHTYTHTHARTRARALTHTHTHTHTQACRFLPL
jgi:hypothetical protein